MNINWKIRFRNPIFWIQIVLSVILPVMRYLGISAEQITSWSILVNIILRAVSNPYVISLVLLSVWNAISDPTSKGIGDCKSVLNQKELR